jgi:hypothetical protein
LVSKDQAIGGVICLVCVVVAILYIIGLFFYEPIINAIPALAVFGTDRFVVQFWLVAIPVLIGFIAILAIGAWIGWTMATTPPPKPIEEITTEMEEKKEEPKMEEMKPDETNAGTMTEEKKPERKKKS